MKKVIYIFALGALILSAASCDLELAPWGSITYEPGDQIITSNEDLDGFEANIMYSMRAVTYGVYDYASDIQMDYFNAAADYGNNGGSIHRSDNSFNASDSNIETYWANMYAAVKNYNIFLEGSLDVPDGINEEKLKTTRGEAFFGRAYSYMCLARHFAKTYNSATASTDLCVPLVTVYDQNARPARATVQEVYDQIKEDLDSAAVCLADVPGALRSIRPTIDAVNAMYARYYLDIKDWSNASRYAIALIDSGLYTLNSSATEFTQEWVYDNGKEPILQYYASASEGAGGHSYYYSVSSMAGKLYTSEYYIPTKDLYDSYSANDYRKSAWFGTTHPDVGGTIISYHVGTYYNENPSNPDYWVFSKYKGNPSYYTSYPDSGQARKPLTIAEMYLIAAEACYNNGSTTEAKTYLNALQASRNATQTNATLEYIKTEWYKETVGQGFRLTCLKRWGDGFNGRTPQTGAASIVMTGSDYEQKYLLADAYQFVWPIPTYEMQVNENLVQNPGYSDLE